MAMTTATEQMFALVYTVAKSVCRGQRARFCSAEKFHELCNGPEQFHVARSVTEYHVA